MKLDLKLLIFNLLLQAAESVRLHLPEQIVAPKNELQLRIIRLSCKEKVTIELPIACSMNFCARFDSGDAAADDDEEDEVADDDSAAEGASS